MGRSEYIAETVTEWKAPDKIDKPDARILTAPNIPQPLHGHGYQPRTIVGPQRWNIMRKRCYMNAHYICEACGADCSAKGQCHAHELFDVDYATGTSTFKRLVALCPICHIRVIHSGRMFTLLKKHDPTMSKAMVLSGLEHGFKVVSEYNKAHDNPIYLFSAILAGLENEEIVKDVEALIKKYGMKFYRPINKEEGQARWQDWKMVYNGKEYHTKFADQNAWEQAMEEQYPSTPVNNPFSGGIFDEINNILKEANNE